MDDFRIRLDQPNEGRSELGVPPGELDSQGGEDCLEVPPVLEVPGAEEGGSQPSIRSRPLRDRLCNGALPRPGEPVQPIDGGFVEVTGPKLDLVQNCCTCSAETTIPIAMSILGLFCAPYIIEDCSFVWGGCFLDDHHGNARRQCILTWILEGEVILCS